MMQTTFSWTNQQEEVIQSICMSQTNILLLQFVIENLRKFLDERLSIDDEMNVVETLLPHSLSNLSKDKVKKSVHRLLLPDFELREVSRSLSVADSVDGEDSTSAHFQLLQQLILAGDEEQLQL